MNFKMVKPLLWKNLLWMGSVIFTAILLVLILILTLPLSKNNKIIYGALISCNYLFIYFISLVLNNSKASVSIFSEVHSKMDLEKKTGLIEIKTSNYVHFFVIIICVITFIIQVTSGGVLILKLNFWTFLKSTWWIFLLVMLSNMLYFYLFFGINTYLLNNDAEFKAEYIKNYFEHKEWQNDIKNNNKEKIDSE